MKNLKLFFILLLFTKSVLSQDQLYKKDNTKLVVKIVEVGPEIIKYKPLDNLNGPVYLIAKKDVSLIIYEDGKHEVITSENLNTNSQNPIASIFIKNKKNKLDSLFLSKYKNSISINFLCFANSELAFIYQRENIKKNYSISIPFSIGITVPELTNMYNTDFYYNNGTKYSELTLNRKLFEIGIGYNYHLRLKIPLNIYIGPAVKLMSYDATQQYYYPYIYHETILSRMTASITNGIVFRTKSRLVFNCFFSLGVKYDVVSSMLTIPSTQEKINPINQPFAFYPWLGLLIGFGL